MVIDGGKEKRVHLTEGEKRVSKRANEEKKKKKQKQKENESKIKIRGKVEGEKMRKVVEESKRKMKGESDGL